MDTVRQIWTIARHSVLQAVRMKLIIVLVAFLVVVVPALPFFLKTDDTHAGQIRMIITYCVYLTTFLLSVLTLFLSCVTLNTEIKGQQIFLVDCKPVSRLTVLLGKWLGVVLIDAALLALMLGMTYGLVRYFGRQWPRPNENLSQYRSYALLRRLGYKWPRRPEPDMAYESFKADMLSARREQRPPMPNIKGMVDAHVAEMKKRDMMPKQKSEEWIRARLAHYYESRSYPVPPGTTIKWTLHGIPKFDGWLVVEFKHTTDVAKTLHEIPGEFIVNESGQPVSKLSSRFRVGRKHMFAVPSTVVRFDEGSRRGWVEIRYTNFDRTGAAALFSFHDGIVVRYAAASQAANFARAGLVVLMLLSFIAIVGIFASTFLSFPVAVLLCLVVFLVGHLANFIFMDIIGDLFLFRMEPRPPGTPMHGGDVALRTALRYFFSIFPNFRSFNVVPDLVDGKLIEWRHMGWCFLIGPVIRGGLLAVAGWYIYRRRELATLTPHA